MTKDYQVDLKKKYDFISSIECINCTCQITLNDAFVNIENLTLALIWLRYTDIKLLFNPIDSNQPFGISYTGYMANSNTRSELALITKSDLSGIHYTDGCASVPHTVNIFPQRL